MGRAGQVVLTPKPLESGHVLNSHVMGEKRKSVFNSKMNILSYFPNTPLNIKHCIFLLFRSSLSPHAADV